MSPSSLVPEAVVGGLSLEQWEAGLNGLEGHDSQALAAARLALSVLLGKCAVEPPLGSQILEAWRGGGGLLSSESYSMRGYTILDSGLRVGQVQHRLDHFPSSLGQFSSDSSLFLGIVKPLAFGFTPLLGVRHHNHSVGGGFPTTTWNVIRDPALEQTGFSLDFLQGR